jgi:hypothetical protein
MSVPNKFSEYFSACLTIICDKSLKEVTQIVNELNIGVAVDCSVPKEIGNEVNSLFNEDSPLAKIRENYKCCKDKFSYASQKEIFISLLKDANLYF